MTIESKNFVATPGDIRALAVGFLEANAGADMSRSTYLKALVGTTQHDLKGTKDITVEMQLKSLTVVHKKFYAAVLEAVVTPEIADSPRLRQEEKTRRALERNRRSNFARSSMTTLKAWLKAAGHNLMELNPAKVSKAQLASEVPAKRHKQVLKPWKVKGNVDKLVAAVLANTRALATSDAAAARMVLDEAMNVLAKELFAASGKATNDPAAAIKEQRPLKIKAGVFWPTDTSVLRRQQRAA